MRISDWSSDVCSSDLNILAPDEGRVAAVALGFCVFYEKSCWQNARKCVRLAEILSQCLMKIASFSDTSAFDPAAPSLPRHPELVSGSMVCPRMACTAEGRCRPWMLNQVQHDGV